MSTAVRVVCFDLDGTLVRGTTVSLHLSEWLGHAPLLSELERQYAEGSIDNRTFAERDAAYYKGLHRSEIWRELEDIPVVDGIPQTLEWLRAHEATPLLATVTSSVAAQFFAQRYGFEDYMGCEMGEDTDGRMLGTIQTHVVPDDKASFLESWCGAHGQTLAQCAAVGDSRADIPLFRAVGLAIALNATLEARAAADIVIDSGDLRLIIPALVNWTARSMPVLE